MLDWPVATCDVIASCARAAVGADGYAGSQTVGWFERQKGRRFITHRSYGEDRRSRPAVDVGERNSTGV